MDIFEVKQEIEKAYPMSIEKIEKIKGVYKIDTSSGVYCVKVILYEFAHFLFILSAIKHLQNKGFERIPPILIRENGLEYLALDRGFAYITPWIDARESNYDNPLDRMKATLKLAELHKKSEGFFLTDEMKPRVGWLKWIENFKIRKKEILSFQAIVNKKEKKTEFDVLYLNMLEEEQERANSAIVNLIKSEYIQKMESDIEKRGFCHHDYAHHNVLVDWDGNINIIDFDYCILDSYLHDLSSLLIRTMKNGKWDKATALSMINVYSSINPIEKRDFYIMASFMEFPQEYWQVGIQYYWEKQPWGEPFFLKKLEKIEEDRGERQEFIQCFRCTKE